MGKKVREQLASASRIETLALEEAVDEIDRGVAKKRLRALEKGTDRLVSGTELENILAALEAKGDYALDKTTVKPGPWEIDTNGWPLIINGPEEGESNVVCTIESRDTGGSEHHYDDSTALANAVLIRAAPDLLECVKGFVESWGAEVDNDEPIQGSDAVDWISGAMLEFQAALAKATVK